MRWLEEEKNKDVEKYRGFFESFGSFIREGVCTDAVNKVRGLGDLSGREGELESEL
jgi:HSP90 family molecular chaperone